MPEKGVQHRSYVVEPAATFCKTGFCKNIANIPRSRFDSLRRVNPPAKTPADQTFGAEKAKYCESILGCRGGVTFTEFMVNQ